MALIKLLILITLITLPLGSYSNSEDETDSSSGIITLKNVVNASWDNNIKPLVEVAGEKWAAFITSSSIDTDKFKSAIKETWGKAVEISQTNKEVNDAGSAIDNFITHSIDDSSESTTQSAQLIEQGKLVDGLWYLSVHLVQDTDTNLAKAAQESELINMLGKITATSYGGPAGAAAYASWYAYKKTNDPEMALKMGIMSGAGNADFSPMSQDSLSIQVKNKIIGGVMAGLRAAISGEDEQSIKNAFLNSSVMSLTQPNQTSDKGGEDTDIKSQETDSEPNEAAKATLSQTP